MKINEVVYDGKDIIGFWWRNQESGEDEFVSLEQIGASDISQLTKLEQELYLKLGVRYAYLEELSDDFKTNPQDIVMAFLEDLISSGSGSDDHIAYAARRWLHAHCIQGKFIR